MEKLTFSLIIIGGLIAVFQKLWVNMIWSFVIFLYRNEFNHDKNPKTPDKFLHYNPNTDKFSVRYIMKYTLFGVRWGFFYEGGFVSKLSHWLDWAADRPNRFPIPVKIDPDDHDSIANLIKKK